MGGKPRPAERVERVVGSVFKFKPLGERITQNTRRVRFSFPSVVMRSAAKLANVPLCSSSVAHAVAWRSPSACISVCYGCGSLGYGASAWPGSTDTRGACSRGFAGVYFYLVFLVDRCYQMFVLVLVVSLLGCVVCGVSWQSMHATSRH